MVWRPHDTGFSALEESPLHVDVEEQLHDTRFSALHEAVNHSIFGDPDPASRQRKIEKLQTMGLIDETGDDDRIRASVADKFNAFFFRKEKNLPERWKRHMFFEAAKLLVSTGVLRLNTCRDWQVNRRNPAENVGLRTFERLENLLWKKYGADSGKKRFFHLHSGSGDNSGVYKANTHRDHPADRTWRHIGFGNKLYAPIETLIGQFLKVQYRDASMHPKDPMVKIVVRILTEAIQKKLHERWYPAGKDVKESDIWAGGGDRQDFNDVLELLRNPRELLAGINFPHAVSIHVAKYQLSGRFSGDKPTYVSDNAELVDAGQISTDYIMSFGEQSVPARNAVVNAYKTLMELSGMPDTLIGHERCKFLEKDADATLGRISIAIKKVHKAHKTSINKSREKPADPAAIHEDDRIQNLESEMLELLPTEIALRILQEHRLESMLAVLQKFKADYIARMKWIRGLLAEKPESAADIEMTLPEAQAQLTAYDRLLYQERTLLWVLNQIDRIQGKCPRKLLDACREVVPGMKKEKENTEVIKRKVKEEENTEVIKRKVSEHLVTIQTQLQETPPTQAEHVHEVFERLFEPEFVAGVERGKTEPASPTIWKLVDSSFMRGDGRRVIEDIPDGAFVRANNMLVTAAKQAVPGADFTIWREGSSIVIDGTCVRTGMPGRRRPIGTVDVQACFALEIREQLDLNECPYAYLRNFVPGSFDEITQHFPPQSFGLISAIRSDSHIDDEAFARLCGDYVQLLQPGGCLITDGIEESYSQVVRLIKSLPEYEAKVEVVMNAKTHRPISLFIQRAHPGGYLTDDEKRSVFRGTDKESQVYFKSPEDIANLRPDLEIRRDICNEIRAVCGHGAFAWIEDQIELDSQGSPSRLQELITGGVVGSLLNEHPELMTESFRHSIARHIVSRHHLEAGSGHPQPSLLQPISQHADSASVADLFLHLHKLPHRTVWEIRKAIVAALLKEPGDVTTDVVQAVERCIMRAFCDERVAADSGGSVTPEKVDAKQRRAEMERLFIRGRNLAYDKQPLLTQSAIGYIQRRTALRALRGIDTGRHMQNPGEYPLRDTPGFIRSFRRRDTDWELPEVRTTLLRDNAEFGTPEAEQRLRAKINWIRDIAGDVLEITGRAPVGFIHFKDCVTNDLLQKRLMRILGTGYPSCVDTAPCTFATGGTAGIEEDMELEESLREWTQCGNKLILGGGSWENAFEPNGCLIKELLKKKLPADLNERNLRLFGICFFNQILGDMVGTLPENLAPTRTVPGPLEIGLATITPTGGGKRHPLFRDCASFTAVMSRGGHLVGDDLHERGGAMQTIARSSSGGTAAWQALEGVISGIQWHPEVRCMQNGRKISDDSLQVLAQLTDQRDHLSEVFDCTLDDLTDNFNAGRAQIKGDAGMEILANALLWQLNALKKNLEARSLGSRR